MDTLKRAADAAFFANLVRETHFYLIRHGESEANALQVIQGHSDYPLNSRGEAQAAAAGLWLAGKGITSLSCSPLSRARRTAEIIAREARIPAPRPEALFIELDTGCFSGLSLSQIQEKFPQLYEEFRYRSWAAVPDAESAPALAERALRAWEWLKDESLRTPGAVAVVSHGGFLQWLVRVTFGCGSWMPLLPTGNCGIFHLTVLPTQAGKPAYLQWKLLNHQPEFDGGTVPPIF
jgi:broad specificity phosphatase PhoE